MQYSATLLVGASQPCVRIPLTVLMQRAGPVMVLSAADGESTIRLVMQHRPQLVLLDLAMSDIDGFTLCHRIRSNTVDWQPMLWLLTDRVSPFDIEATGSAGADRAIAKPIDPDRLLKQVRERLLPHAAA